MVQQTSRPPDWALDLEVKVDPDWEANYLSRTTGQVIKAWREHRGYSVARVAANSLGRLTQIAVSLLETEIKDVAPWATDRHFADVARALHIPLWVIVLRLLPGEASVS